MRNAGITARIINHNSIGSFLPNGLINHGREESVCPRVVGISSFCKQNMSKLSFPVLAENVKMKYIMNYIRNKAYKGPFQLSKDSNKSKSLTRKFNRDD